MKMNKQDIKAILPHRDPILLVDEVVEIKDGESITTKLFISETMDVLRGHFPGDPVLPGVYTIESAGQAAALLMRASAKYKGKTPLLAGVNNARFKRKVLPRDTLTIFTEVIREREDKGIITFLSKALVNEELAAELEIILAMR